MKERTKKIIEEFFNRNENLIEKKDSILEISKSLVECYKNGGQVLICGNGGSSSDSDHIVGELMKGFVLRRPLNDDLKEKFKRLYKDKGEEIANKLQGSLPAISLNTQSALISAFNNDVDPDLSYAQQVMGYGRKNDILIGISTSGNAVNVNNAMITAKVLGLKTVGLSGRDGGNLAKVADMNFISPAEETYRIQEYHLFAYHLICMYVESELFDF